MCTYVFGYVCTRMAGVTCKSRRVYVSINMIILIDFLINTATPPPKKKREGERREKRKEKGDSVLS